MPTSRRLPPTELFPSPSETSRAIEETEAPETQEAPGVIADTRKTVERRSEDTQKSPAPANTR